MGMAGMAPDDPEKCWSGGCFPHGNRLAWVLGDPCTLMQLQLLQALWLGFLSLSNKNDLWGQGAGLASWMWPGQSHRTPCSEAPVLILKCLNHF